MADDIAKQNSYIMREGNLQKGPLLSLLRVSARLLSLSEKMRIFAAT